jgi:hypothetical protein
VISSAITIEGSGSTIGLDSGAPDFRILAVKGTGNLTLKDTKISGGVASASSGGGIFNYNGTAILEGSTVADNSATYSGGGIFSHAQGGESAVLTLTNSTVSGNSSGVNGGGVFHTASNIMFAASSTLTLTNSTVSGNSASGSGGGVSHSVSTASAGVVTTLTNSTVSGNSASGDGGGVFNHSFIGVATVILTNSILSGNSAGSSGGGMLNRSNFAALNTVTLTNSTVSGNPANSSGGGLYNRDNTLTVTNSTLSGNSAGSSGGGVWNSIISFGEVSTVELINSTVTGNIAGDKGGGVYNLPNSGSSTVMLTHSLLSGNTASTGAEVANSPSGTIIADAYNLFGHSGLTNAQAFSSFAPGVSDLTATFDGTTPTALSALLNTTLANNGGPTKTHNLVLYSPAIDATPAFDCPPPATDQRGFARPVDGDSDTVTACDIGGVEFSSTTPDPCIGAVPTPGCTINGVLNQLCQGTSGNDLIVGTSNDAVMIGGAGDDEL